MEFTLSLITLLATFAVTLAQQQPQPTQENAPLAPQGRSSPLLGVRYSAATDVSHISFNSPLVTYGSSLSEIQLPAAPIQPANLKQTSQGDNNSAAQGDQGSQQGQTLVRSFGNQGQIQQQQVQTPAAADQRQFISVQQYPANPQAQSNTQSFSLPQQPQQQSAPRYAPQFPVTQSQPQPQFPQPQYATSAAQPQYANSVAQPQYAINAAQPQQFGFQQPQTYVPTPQQYVAPQQLPLQYPTAPVTNGYFATGPYAAQPVAPVVPQFPQPVAPAAPLVSRVAFNGPVAGFSYSF